MAESYLRPLRGRPRDEEADAAILDATLAMLAEAGYAGLRIEAVAARAGVAKTTIYRRWPDKLSLAIAALKLIPELPAVDTGSLTGDLCALRAAVISLFETTRLAGVLPALAAERVRGTSAAAKLDTFIRERYQPWVGAIERAIERGELPRSASADPLLIADLLSGVLMQRVFFTGGRVDERAWQTVLDIVVTGVRAAGDRG